MTKRINVVLILELVLLLNIFVFNIAAVHAETEYDIVYAATKTDFETPCDSIWSRCADVKINGSDDTMVFTAPASYKVYALSQDGSLFINLPGANCFLHNPVINKTVKVIESSDALDPIRGARWYEQDINNVGTGQYKHRFYCETYDGEVTFEDSVEVCIYDSNIGGCGISGEKPSPSPAPPTPIPPTPPSPKPKPTVNMKATPETIFQGGTTTISWTTTNATNCKGSRGESYKVNDSFPATPTTNTTYSLTCTGPGGSDTDSVTVTVQNRTPIGFHDGVDNANCRTTGWAYDPDASSGSIEVHIYRDGPAGGGGVILNGFTTNLLRGDANTKYGITGNHGFDVSLVPYISDGKSHELYIYPIDYNNPGIDNSKNPLIGTPQTIICPKPVSVPGKPLPSVDIKAE